VGRFFVLRGAGGKSSAGEQFLRASARVNRHDCAVMEAIILIDEKGDGKKVEDQDQEVPAWRQ